MFDAAAAVLTAEQGEGGELTVELLGMGLEERRLALGFPIGYQPSMGPPPQSVRVRLMEILLAGSGRQEPSTSATTIGFLPSSTTEESEWAELPEELMLMVLDRLDWARRESAAVRLTCRRWRNIHDGGRKTLELLTRPADEAVKTLCGRLPALTSLGLHMYANGMGNLTEEGLWAVAGLTSLTHLNLAICNNVTAEGLRAVAGITSLTSLHLDGNLDGTTDLACDNVTGEGLQAVAGLTSLKHLRLVGRNKLTDKGLCAVAELTSLTHLNLALCPSITDEGLRVVGGLYALTKLDLYDCSSVTDVGVEHLSHLKHLAYLDLSFVNLTDKGLSAVAELTSLTDLSLEAKKVTDEGLRAVAGLTSLTTLYLGCKKVTDAGLLHLSDLKQLNHLNLDDCDTTEAAEEELCRQIPGLFIQNERD